METTTPADSADGPAQLLVSERALLQNLDTYRALAPGSEAACVVKADAYGCSARLCSRLFYDAGVRRFFVATYEEAQELVDLFDEEEKLGLRVYVLADRFTRMASPHPSVVPVVSSSEDLGALLAQLEDPGARPRDVCLHGETGMNRFALPVDEIEPALQRLGGLREQGRVDEVLVMSHLACADDPQASMNEAQALAFERMVQDYPWLKTSLAGTGGTQLGKRFQRDIIRVGIGMYGGESSTATDAPKLEPVIAVSAPIIQVKTVERGQSVGYGAAFTADRAMKVATVRLGYADGIDRRFSELGLAGYISGEPCPVIGRVSMDLITLDVTHIDEAQIPIGARALFLVGEQDINWAARQLGTISYEVLTSLGARLERRLV